ncbi:hypothetical protein E2C01_056537 [Portunus trituberculatus]|uniref:Uncharacterized protein n=1 Tax=Portunus trituberculatus TaxID=210409 RepID=A0A5B7GUE6_PORTR|nr:hypothetical protein [Portunus trituberculatus]
MYSMRTGCIKPRFGRFKFKERLRNVCLHARHYDLCYELSTKRWVSDMETVIILGKISIISPQVLPNWQRHNTRGTSALGDPEE